jgi:hypothetical protein
MAAWQLKNLTACWANFSAQCPKIKINSECQIQISIGIRAARANIKVDCKHQSMAKEIISKVILFANGILLIPIFVNFSEK